MSLSVLLRRIENAQKTRSRFIEEAKQDRRYLKRDEWRKSFIYPYIKAAQEQNKHLEKGAVGRTLEQFWSPRGEWANLSKLQLFMAFDTRLRLLERTTVENKKKGMKKKLADIKKKRDQGQGHINPAYESPGSRKGSAKVEPHSVVVTRRSRKKGPRVTLRKSKGRVSTPRVPRRLSIPTNPTAPADHPLPDDRVPSSTLTATRSQSPDVTLRIRGGGKKKRKPKAPTLQAAEAAAAVAAFVPGRAPAPAAPAARFMTQGERVASGAEDRRLQGIWDAAKRTSLLHRMKSEDEDTLRPVARNILHSLHDEQWDSRDFPRYESRVTTLVKDIRRALATGQGRGWSGVRRPENPEDVALQAVSGKIGQWRKDDTAELPLPPPPPLPDVEVAIDLTEESITEPTEAPPGTDPPVSDSSVHPHVKTEHSGSAPKASTSIGDGYDVAGGTSLAVNDADVDRPTSVFSRETSPVTTPRGPFPPLSPMGPPLTAADLGPSARLFVRADPVKIEIPDSVPFGRSPTIDFTLDTGAAVERRSLTREPSPERFVVIPRGVGVDVGAAAEEKEAEEKEEAPVYPAFGPEVLLAAAPIPAAPIPAAAPVALPVPVPVIPRAAGAGAVLYSVPTPTNLGSAPAVNVLNKSAFATSWSGLAYSMVDIPLRHGNMRLTGFSATITCNNRAGGDISAIAAFIRKHFRLGGVIDGRRYSSADLTHHIIHNLPGRFEIQS